MGEYIVLYQLLILPRRLIPSIVIFPG